jgi:hypothetical protein
MNHCICKYSSRAHTDLFHWVPTLKLFEISWNSDFLSVQAWIGAEPPRKYIFPKNKVAWKKYSVFRKKRNKNLNRY